MTELAQQAIAENKAKHARGEDARVLDLGNCGLTELPDLSGMDWLETLIPGDPALQWRDPLDGNSGIPAPAICPG